MDTRVVTENARWVRRRRENPPYFRPLRSGEVCEWPGHWVSRSGKRPPSSTRRTTSSPDVPVPPDPTGRAQSPVVYRHLSGPKPPGTFGPTSCVLPCLGTSEGVPPTTLVYTTNQPNGKFFQVNDVNPLFAPLSLTLRPSQWVGT